MLLPDWVAEQPEAHLLPHIRALCEREGSPLRLVSTKVEDAEFVVTLEWTRASANPRNVTSATYSLLGTIAESNTHVREEAHGGAIDFVITTGLLDGDGPFKAHGHVVRFHVTGQAIADMLRRRL